MLCLGTTRSFPSVTVPPSTKHKGPLHSRLWGDMLVLTYFGGIVIIPPLEFTRVAQFILCVKKQNKKTSHLFVNVLSDVQEV